MTATKGKNDQVTSFILLCLYCWTRTTAHRADWKVLACFHKGLQMLWSMIRHLTTNNSAERNHQRKSHRMWGIHECLRDHRIQPSKNRSKRIQESSVTHMETALSSCSSGRCVLSQYIYKSHSLYLYWVFLRQKANETQSPPKREEAEYLQIRLLPWQKILSFCGSEGQKDNMSSSHTVLKRNVKPRRWQLWDQQTACKQLLTLNTLPCPVLPFKQSQHCLSVLWAFGQRPVRKTRASH